MMTTTTLGRKMRVVCLHGWRTNARVLQHQSAGLRAALGDEAGTFEASGPPQEAVQTFYRHEAPFYEWWNAVKLSPPYTTSDKGASERYAYRYEGVEETLRLVSERLEALHPVDVLVGFSQGAGLATLLTAKWLQERDSAPWKVCVLVSGFRPRAEEVRHLLENEQGRHVKINVPSIHLIGEADAIVRQCEDLFETYADASEGVRRLKFLHGEGHKFPTPGKHADLYRRVACELKRMVLYPQAETSGL
ncbi:hypothetical protein ATCC90586_001877 [Pythium insidiosum]|nr:hypothetical protein ATCC90586_001877 [Pythium insidiosum]